MIALFDPYIGGHHAEYLAHLVEYQQNTMPETRLEVVTPLENVTQHPYLQVLLKATPPNLAFHLIPKLQETSLTKQSYEQAQVLDAYILAHKPQHVLFMYFDLLQLPLWNKLRYNFPISFSGIYFRPMWHYGNWHTLSWKDCIKSWRQRFILRGAMRNPHLKTLFCLDPFVADILQKKHPKKQFVPLYDPLDIEEGTISSMNLRTELAISNERKIFLLMGYLEARKGVLTSLEAIQNLNEANLSKAAFVFAGKLQPDIEAEVRRILATLPSSAMIRITDSFVPYSDFQAYIEQSDVVLLPYQNHVGSSGLLLRAAHAQKPVLCQYFGLMGFWTKQNELGETCNCFDVQALSNTLKSMIETPIPPIEAQSFLDAHTVSAFQETIMTAI